MKHISETLRQYYMSKITVSHSWVLKRKFPHGGNRWLVLCFWVVWADLYFLNKPVSWGVIIGCQAANVSDLYVWVKVLTVSYQLAELTCETYIHKNGENICITVIFFVLVSSFFPPTQTHTAVFYLPGSSSRWWYIVNFNTQILDILYGCELLSNSNWCLASGRFSFRKQQVTVAEGVQATLSHIYRLLLTSLHAVSPFLSSLTEHRLKQGLQVGAASAYFAVYDGSCSGTLVA